MPGKSCPTMTESVSDLVRRMIRIGDPSGHCGFVAANIPGDVGAVHTAGLAMGSDEHQRGPRKQHCRQPESGFLGLQVSSRDCHVDGAVGGRSDRARACPRPAMTSISVPVAAANSAASRSAIPIAPPVPATFSGCADASDTASKETRRRPPMPRPNTTYAWSTSVEPTVRTKKLREVSYTGSYSM